MKYGKRVNMFDEEKKKEMLEDTYSEKRRKAFEEADKRAQIFIKKHWPKMTVDQVIRFLVDVQKITGPFPISKEVSAPPYDFRL